MIIDRANAARALVLSAAFSAMGGAWFGCSSSSTDGGTPTADGGSDGDLTATDASADVVATDSAEAGSSDKTGAIFAISDTETIDGGAQSNYRVGGSFTHTTTPDSTTTSKTVGPCLLETIGDGAMAVEESLSAGVVHIAGGAKAIDLSPKSDNSYAVVTEKISLWTGGETLTVRGDGKDVPAFMTSITAPSKLTLTAPTVTLGSLTVTRSAGVNATFTGASSGDVVLYFDTATPTKAFAATCTFKASVGSGQIPAAAFADFPAGDGTFNFYVKESSVATPPGWTVRFTASKAVVNAAGAAMIGQATFN